MKEEAKGEKQIVKYIGESNRSGYERGKEHLDQFRNMDERSHLLKHYLQFHRGIEIEDMEIGMKVRSTFKSAIERQISEAVAICKEEREGTSLMNSKAEYNRCKLPRLNTQSLEDQMKEAEAEKEKEKELNKQIRDLKKEKKSRKKENIEAEEEDLLKVCNDMISEEGQKWKRRRKEEEAKRNEIDKIEEIELEKKLRLNRANGKKKETRRKLVKEGKVQRESKKESWRDPKKKMWRKIR